MEKTRFDGSLLDIMLEEEAWKNISRSEALTEAQLDKYRGKLDWEAVTSNPNMHWTPSLMERFKHSLDWGVLSATAGASLLVPEVIERFKDRWDWGALSENSDLPLETVEMYPDRINWSVLIRRYHSSDRPFTRAFFEKWADRIPAEEFKESTLWYDLVDEQEKELKRRLMLED